MDFCETNPSRSMTVVNDELSAEPEKYFASILGRLGLPYEQPVADFFRTHRISSSFPQASRDARGTHRFPNPWTQCSDEQRAIFMREAASTMLRYALATEDSVNRRDADTSEPAPSRDPHGE